MTPEQKLERIAAILKEYEELIDEAVENDSEVTLGGNGINSGEAAFTFGPLNEEIQEVLTE
jgi:hypothetical protein